MIKTSIHEFQQYHFILYSFQQKSHELSTYKYGLTLHLNFQTRLILLSYPQSPNSCPEAVVDCFGKPRIFIQCSCLIAPPRGRESALCRTRMLCPNTGRKVDDWLLRGFIQCAYIQVIIARSITASMHKFRGCGYDDGFILAFRCFHIKRK